MRWFLRILLLIVIVVPAAWMAAEALLARKVGQIIADDPRIAVQSVAAKREWWRFGLDLTGVRIDTDQGPAGFPKLQVWAAASRMNEFHLTLPPQMTLPIAGRTREVTAHEIALSLRISPFSGMAMTRAVATSGPVSIDGQQILDALLAQMQMVGLGPDAPRDARVAYAVALHAAGMNPTPVDPRMAALPTPIGLDGRARLWMTRPINSGAASGMAAQVDGASSDGITITLGDLTARLMGRVEADAQGFASGTLDIYTADARGFLDVAAQAGTIPTGSVMLADTLITGLGTEPAMDAAQQDDTGTAGAPPARAGELRLPIILRDGRATLRGIPLGPAPRLR